MEKRNPYWGRGYMPEATKELLRHGFVYHHTCTEVPVPLMNEIRVGHTNYMTKEYWKKLYK